MLRRFFDVWLPRFLFGICLAAALTLAGAVLLSPSLCEPDSPFLLRLFAEDATVRRIALVSAGGLVVSACLFFRLRDPEAKRQRRDPPRTMAGA
ncbi:MAG: hypothetical protein U0793_25775 [Gemmataceae bacterium]